MGLKDVVVQKLQQYFGDFVEGLTPENLEMQVLAGTITQTRCCSTRRAGGGSRSRFKCRCGGRVTG